MVEHPSAMQVTSWAGRVGPRLPSNASIAAPIKLDAQKVDIRYAANQRFQQRPAAFFDDVNRFRGCAHYADTPSSVKVPVAIATGRASSSSVAVTRTKATDRVT